MKDEIELFIGKELDTDEEEYVDGSHSRAVFICGKRGSGKSYSMGDIIEEVHDHTQGVVPLIVDPMGIYWTMVSENEEQQNSLWDWGLQSRAYRVNLLVPGNPKERYGEEVLSEMKRRGLEVSAIKINPSDISPDGWCDLFDLNINKPMGITLYRAIRNLSRQQGNEFNLDDIIDTVEGDAQSNERTKEALLNRLEMSRDWGLFSDTYTPIWDRLDETSLNVLDLSVVDPGKYGLRNLVVSVLCRDLFKRRIKARKREELELQVDVPRVWLFIDEAHNFVPSGESSLSKDILIRWVKEGRQPGVSLTVATQQPSALDHDMVSQCDVILCHKITTREDIQELNRLSQDYMSSELKTYIQKLDRVGQAVYVDDEDESISIVQMRPRRSRHGGGEN
ncbi:ATP-binding protein [Halogeometricum limi]|uniref:Helicase HerA central domain-containing protein n=1 Tax=Halogeometricum limi TaxID=555875 RepID=A0A1I6HV34_9EURY|nr:ATP-binding protein [Halogeometricum limi]SFR58294.1 hypothetical protein SAMN04488124_2494 [Halogeometricum limi]